MVEFDAENCHERLRPLAAETLAAVSIPLEVMDRPTADMLRRLAENGLVVPSARASRVLYPRAAEPTLTPGEQRRAGTARDQHARRLKMAGVLAAEEMTEEARAAAIQAIHELGKAIAIEQGQPEPANARGAVAPPLDAHWPASALAAARHFLQEETAPIGPLLQALGSPAEAGAERAREFFEDIKARLGAIRD